MQFSALRYFTETLRLGSIRRASEVLHVTPSAISRQIALLEQDFGAPLFERHALGMRLTAAGEVFARQALSTQRDFDRLRSDLDDLQNLRRGVVRISSMEGAVSGLVYRAMREFSGEFPGINYEVVVGGSEVQVVALAREEFDLSIAFNPPPHKDVTLEHVMSDPVCAILHPSHPLAAKRALKLADLADQRIALLDHTFVTRTLLDSAAASEGVLIPATLTINHIGHAINYARQRMGISFAPRHIVQDEVDSGALKALPVDHPLLSSARTVLCRHKHRTPTRAAQAFLTLLKKHFQALERRPRSRPRRR